MPHAISQTHSAFYPHRGFLYKNIYIFLKCSVLDIIFLSCGVYFIYRNCWKENRLRFRQTLNWKRKYEFPKRGQIERSGAVSNVCQSWHLWGMSLDCVVNWLMKKKGNQYKKYRPILGYSYFIRKGAFYLERRKESRGWAISSIFFQPLLFTEVFSFFATTVHAYS